MKQFLRMLPAILVVLLVPAMVLGQAVTNYISTQTLSGSGTYGGQSTATVGPTLATDGVNLSNSVNGQAGRRVTLCTTQPTLCPINDGGNALGFVYSRAQSSTLGFNAPTWVREPAMDLPVGNLGGAGNQCVVLSSEINKSAMPGDGRIAYQLSGVTATYAGPDAGAATPDAAVLCTTAIGQLGIEGVRSN